MPKHLSAKFVSLVMTVILPAANIVADSKRMTLAVVVVFVVLSLFTPSGSGALTRPCVRWLFLPYAGCAPAPTLADLVGGLALCHPVHLGVRPRA